MYTVPRQSMEEFLLESLKVIFQEPFEEFLQDFQGEGPPGHNPAEIFIGILEKFLNKTLVDIFKKYLY